MPSPPESPRWSVRERLLDATVLFAAVVLAWVLPSFLPSGPPEPGPLTGALGFAVVGTVLHLTRNRPDGVRSAVAGACVAGVTGWVLLAPGQVATADDPTNLLMSLAPLLPLYAGYLYSRDRRRAWIVVASLTVVVVRPWSGSEAATVSGLLYVCAPMLFGFYLTARRMLLRTLTERAEAAERESDLRAERARAQERVRLAVDLHDVVTHRVSLMVLHAGAVRVTATDDATRKAAEDVRATGCGALAELRELIGVLRSSAGPMPPSAPDTPAMAATARANEREQASSASEPLGTDALSTDGRDARPAVTRSDWLIVAAAVVLAALATTSLAAWEADAEGTDLAIPWFDIAIQLPAAAALRWRRRRPHLVAVAAIVTSAIMVGLSLSASGGGLATSASTALLVPAATPWVSYAVAAYSRRSGVGALCVLGLLVLAARPWAPYAAVVSVAAVYVGVPALLGLSIGAWRRLVAALTDRADRAEREQELLAARARAGERARLAGEMHHIVAGSVHAMVAGADRWGEASSPATRDAAVELIATGRQALDELDELVDALRSAQSVPARDHGELGPDGGRRDLAPLIAESASVGVPVVLTEEGDPALASPPIARMIWRIVGEALTNVRKHAFGAPVVVRVRYGVDQVRVGIHNGPAPTGDGPRRGDAELAAGGSGTGLLGVRQRVELVNGTLEAGSDADGGFVVESTLPTFVPTSSRSMEESGR